MMQHLQTWWRIKRFLSLAIAFFWLDFSSTILPSQAHPHLSIDSQVKVNNIGAIKIGMTKEEAEAVSKVRLIRHPQVTTISGAKVGDTEEEIKAIYPNIEVREGFYGGKYFIYKPQDSVYKEYTLLFEYSYKRVTRFRVGYKDYVIDLVEGCS